LLLFFHFFDPVRIPERVQSVLTARVRWRHIRNHRRLAIPSEGVFEDLSELASSEGEMLLFQVQGSDAFLQGQQ